MKNDNKGFSLIELIVVIAIMAILVGVLAPNVMKYVERSRESSDKQTADMVRTAVMTAIVDPAITDGSTPGAVTGKDITADPFTPTTDTQFSKVFKDNLGTTGGALDVANSLKSKKYKGAQILVTIDSSNAVVVQLKGTNAADEGKKWLYDTKTGSDQPQS